MDEVILKVGGMSCEHCVSAIKKSVGEISGVSEVEVDLEKGEVTVKYDAKDVDLQDIKNAIEDQGYEV